MSFPASPIHRMVPHPRDPVLYLATSNRVHKYNLPSSRIVATFTCPVPDAFAQYLQVSLEWLFITGGEKRLAVLNANTLEQVGEFWLLKRASAIAYDEASAQIVVADKTGEVYSFPWPIPPANAEKYKTLSSLPPVDARTPLTKPTDDRFLGRFLLSHSSSIVACTFATAPWGRILVTVDRDEHVRVSCFPETWVIAAMGLGHTAFVSCVAEVTGGIVSGGGDKRVIKWDYAGKRLQEHQISQGSCVRLVHPWRDLVVVVGEREAKEGEVITSVVDILKASDLRVVEQLTVTGAVLDITFHGDVMFLSTDFDGVLIREYRQTPGGFKEVDTERWNMVDSLETGAKVEIYWLESMRKLLGHIDDD